MRQPAHFRRARISLQVKLIVGLIVIVLAPLLVAAYFVGQLGDVTTNFARNETRAMRGVVDHADEIYRRLIDARLEVESEVARRLAADPSIVHADPIAPLDKIMARENGLIGLELSDPDGRVVARASRPRPAGPFITHHIDQALPAGASLGLDFAEPDIQGTYYPELEEARAKSHSADPYRSAIPSGQKVAFLALLSGAVLIAIVIGVFASRRVTVRVAALLDATRQVSAGHLDARATLRGRDEMAELAVAFNTMLDDLESKRAQIEYLQRIGAWQDVARKLAHEIKNPLTPIQLAVQQTATAYKGDDERFKRQLADTVEIVEEEIEGLRRLVDTFRTLGALPKVEAAPLALTDVIDDLKLDPQFASVAARAPATPVTVRADKLLLKRVLANLIENGLHAAQDAGASTEVVVSWSASAADGTATITVDDHGPGVPPESHAKIFEPYVTTKTTGTGLGLAISKKIALEHDGDLTISPDRAPTGGARFVLTLPLA
jgi:signal transduction histidine kinase